MVKDYYEIPDEPTRKLLAELILEEALETIDSLGFALDTKEGDGPYDFQDFALLPVYNKAAISLEDVIDGCCDTIYVCIGALVACGVPDLPHLAEVCRANNDKFPGGLAAINVDTGKYLKPEGWVGPQHEMVQSINVPSNFSMLALQKSIYLEGM